jgi:phage tail sheath protein FI
MPIPLSYPGVYIEEVPSGVRTITGVATAITAFIGRTRRGPVNQPVRVQSFAEFTRIFGPLWQESSLGYAVSQFFQHGGGDALIVRVFKGGIPASTASLTLAAGSGELILEASSPGLWGNALRAIVDHDTKDPSDLLQFNLTIQEMDSQDEMKVVSREVFRNLSVDPLNPLFVDSVLSDTARSTLMRVRQSAPSDQRPVETSKPLLKPSSVSDGEPITNAEILGNPDDPDSRTGLYALEAADLFNLLCIPPPNSSEDVNNVTWEKAAQYCLRRRALLIIDPPSKWSSNPGTAISEATAGVNTLRGVIGSDSARNAAVYFPRLRMADPLNGGRLAEFAPCGAIAGIMARTDAQRGVWKAPAGLEASFSGVQEFSYTMTDAQNGLLNPLGLNALRSFPVAGQVVWGARTLAGADQLASEWKYLPVRRFALFLEESLYRGTQWVVFEPNDEPLWAQIRLNVGAFMHNLFRQGAFQGQTPREAYIVKCDRETTTQNDINLGVVNILVGFAPLKPAEFVVIRIQQMAGQIAT